MDQPRFLVFALLLACAGCGSTPAVTPPTSSADPAEAKAAKDLTSRARVEGLERLEIPTGGVLLVKPDHHMASYDQLLVDPIVVTFARGSKKLSSAETERLEVHLREATARELVDIDPSKIVDQPGPCVLTMQTAFLDLELPEISTTSGSRSSYVRSYGSVTLVHEMRDSTTGTVLLRYMGRRRAGGGSGVASVSRWSGLTRTFDDMLADLQKSLIEAVPHSQATEGPQAACEGLIYKTIEAGREESDNP